MSADNVVSLADRGPNRRSVEPVLIQCMFCGVAEYITAWYQYGPADGNLDGYIGCTYCGNES